MKNRSLEELKNFIEMNIKINLYTPLNKIESKVMRDYYLQEWENNFNLPLLNFNGEIFDNDIKISNGYERLVIGDYGIYLEINSDQIVWDNLYIRKDQEWRLDLNRYPNTKYYWYEVDYNSTKIYYQINPVRYADYKIGYYYVSPYEVIFKEKFK